MANCRLTCSTFHTANDNVCTTATLEMGLPIVTQTVVFEGVKLSDWHCFFSLSPSQSCLCWSKAQHEARGLVLNTRGNRFANMMCNRDVVKVSWRSSFKLVAFSNDHCELSTGVPASSSLDWIPLLRESLRRSPCLQSSVLASCTFPGHFIGAANMLSGNLFHSVIFGWTVTSTSERS